MISISPEENKRVLAQIAQRLRAGNGRDHDTEVLRLSLKCSVWKSSRCVNLQMARHYADDSLGIKVAT